MSKENEEVFKHCDSFVVLSGDEQKKKEWLQFGQNLGLECVGCLDSSLDGKEEIYSRKPFFQGKIVGLERGEILENSAVINAVVSDIIQKSRYGEKEEKSESFSDGTLIDDTELGFELGYGKNIFTEDGTPLKKVKWSENAVPKIYKSINEKNIQDSSVKINGIRANFILCAICKALKHNNINDISSYDIRTKSYIPIKTLPKKKGVKQTEGLLYNIIENNENIFMDVDITKEQYSLDDYKQCILPKIKNDKNLYLSGRMPLWLLASISSSYDTNKTFTFQPGKGFTCISSIDEKDLGTIVDGADGIDINKYFEDKKTKTNLPTVIKKQNLLTKFKNWFTSFKETQENKKYLNNTIKSNIIIREEPNIPAKNTFQSDLHVDVTELSNKNGQISTNSQEHEV